MNQKTIYNEYDAGRNIQTDGDDNHPEAEYFGTLDGRRDFLEKLNLVDDKFLVKVVPREGADSSHTLIQQESAICAPQIIISSYCPKMLMFVMNHVSSRTCACCAQIKADMKD